MFMVEMLGVNPLAEAWAIKCLARASQVPVSEPYKIVIGRHFCVQTAVSEAIDVFVFFTGAFLRLWWNEVGFRLCLNSARILNPSGLIVKRCLILNL